MNCMILGEDIKTPKIPAGIITHRFTLVVVTFVIQVLLGQKSRSDRAEDNVTLIHTGIQ